MKSDGSHGGKWIKGKLVSVDGSMVGLDLGTRIIKVNISKIRKDHTPIEDVDVPLDPAALAASDVDSAVLIQEADAKQVGPETFEYGNYTWQPVMRGKIDFLELFSGSARLSQVAAMNGLRVGQPIDLRTGFDLLTSEGRAQTMKIIEEQKPEIIFLAPVCGPWSIMQKNLMTGGPLKRKEENTCLWLNFVSALPITNLHVEDTSFWKILRHPLCGM